MVADSILGSLYRYWLCSGIFRFLHGIFALFQRAFHTSRIVAFFQRDSAFQRAYAHSLFHRIMVWVLDGLMYLPRRLYDLTPRARSGSLLLRLFSGSRLVSFETLLGAFVFVMFVTPHNYWANSYAFLAAGGLFVLYGLLVCARKREPLYPAALGFPFILFALSCALSMLVTHSRSDSFRVLLFFITAFLLTFVIAADITDEKRLMKLLGFLYAAVMVTSLFALAQRVMGIEADSLLTDMNTNVGVPGRVFSTLDNPNNYAEFLVLFLPLCAGYAMNVKRPLYRVVLCLGLALPALALLMTYSRSCWIAIVLSAIVFVMYADRKLLPILFLGAVLLFPFLPDSVMTRIASIFKSGDTSAAHRKYIWSGIVLLLEDKGQWLTGIGLGPDTFQEVYPAYARKWATDGVYHSQMLYLELFLEMGLLGFVSFMWMMLRDVKEGARALYAAHSGAVKLALVSCCASFVGIAAAGLFEYIWFYPRVLFAFFLLLGICIACTRMARKETSLA